MSTVPTTPPETPSAAPPAVPPLRDGDRLSRDEFERRYHAMPHVKKAELETKGVKFYSDVNVVDEGPLAGWRWVYFSDPDGLALELVQVAYYLKEQREDASAEYLRTRPALEEIEARLA